MRAAWSILLFSVGAAAACGSKTPAPTQPEKLPDHAAIEPAPPATPATPATPGKPVSSKSLASTGLDPDALNKAVDPCDDFYEFACGGWMKHTEIAADKPMAMRSFVDIEDRNLAWEHTALEAARTNPGKDEVLAKLGAFYGSCMDEAAIEQAGIKPIAPLLAIIGKVKDAKSLTAAVAQLHAAGMGSLFAFGSAQDAGDATKVIGSIDQGGIGLPDRDYYLKDDAQNKTIRGAYAAYVASMLEEVGRKPDVAKAQAAEIIALETEIAKVSLDKVARRDPKATYNKIDRAGVAKAMAHFDWNTYWKTLGLASISGITVASPAYLTGLDALVTSVKPATWQNYLTFHVVSRSASFLTKALQDKGFKFEQALTGQPEQPPRWKRCVGATDSALGDLLGQAFVRERFAGDSKAAAEGQVQAIAAAMSGNLEALPWMDAQTKVKAAAKLKAMSYQIGYPRKWKTYAFKVDAKSWGANALAGRKDGRGRDLAKIGKPVDKDDWQMTTPTVNAYYDAQLNGMVFPAGILQPPFYSVASSIPVNLGGMGVVVGHELTHGFDDQGAQYDALGNLTNWWQPDTEQAFKAKTKCVIDQYNAYEVEPGVHVNGANTIGENIADIGGVKLALAAYRALRSTAPDAVVADGFTEDQQFFLGFGQAWCAKARPDFAKLLANVDVHSPAKWRVNGALQATPAFAKAFSCKAGARMLPRAQCTVW
jgi:putative endopeptidase